MPDTTEKTIIEELEERIADNCQKVDLGGRYDDMLDECYSLEKVGGPFAHMSASSVLREVDPVAYRCGKNDWADGESFVEVYGETYEESEAEAQREELLSELDSEIEDLETNIDTDTENGSPEPEMVATWTREKSELTTRRDALKHYEWSR